MAQRYSERRIAYSTFVNIASGLRDNALEREWGGLTSPADQGAEQGDLVGLFKPLQEALNEVLLLGTQETREAAERLELAVTAYVWSWLNDDYRSLDQAFIDFRAAARHDLGIEAGAPEVATGKPEDVRSRGHSGNRR